MKCTFAVALGMIFSSCFCHAQTSDTLASVSSDTLAGDIPVNDIRAQGKVTDARTNKGIRATINYSSIPTGSISGNFLDSTFSFEIFGTARYQITAKAKGYNTRTVILDPKDVGENKRVSRDIKLMPSGETIRLNHLIFPQGKAVIDPQSFKELDEIALMLKENEKMVIQLEGHTDNVGNSSGNKKLSQERVEAVKDYLIKMGANKKQVKTKAFGGTHPLRNEMTPEARTLNRRVEMRILKDGSSKEDVIDL